MSLYLVPFLSCSVSNNVVTLKSGLGVQRSLKIVPLKSLATVSYSHSIATMAVCIFSRFDIIHERDGHHTDIARRHRAAKTNDTKGEKKTVSLNRIK